ncbi:hypothetical protein ACH4TP_23740 [Streptomyces sp. NPDC021012]|uniref:hypothetical protein n=1 Tax=Streptomyces sp. NPDC021012 TaxID=3365107 RepID=UPI0037BD3BE7
MLMRHAVEEDVLHLALPHDLDVPSRAAAASQVETLLFTHRPRHVRIQLSTPDPSPASLSVPARARRLCEGLKIPLTVVGPATPRPPLSPAAA